MTTRPTIFISAVSKELKSARQLVANTLQFLGYEPVWQESFGTGQGDLRAMLRQKIDACNGVVQLIGHRYGAEPPAPDEQFGRVSYTQYEALYSRQQGKKVWYLLLDEDFPADAHDPEPAELQELQAAYRRRLQGDAHLYHPLNSREALEAGVLKLRDDLTRLRRGVKRWAVSVAALLVLILGVVLWLAGRQEKVAQQLNANAETMRRVETRLDKERTLLAQVLQRAQQKARTQEELTPKQRFDLALDDIAREQHQPADDLRAMINLFVATVEADPQADPLDKALAAMARQQFAEAASLARGVAEEARHNYQLASKVESQAAARKEKERLRAIVAYQVEGEAHESAIHYELALTAFQAAVALVDKDKEPGLWADAQAHVALVLDEGGKFAEAEKQHRAVLAARERVLGSDHPDTLTSRNDLATALEHGGKYPEAEKEHRTVLAIRERVLGPEHPETLRSRYNLAATLADQGNFPEAEKEHRAVLAIRERVLGPAHRDTLASRNDLAVALDNEGKYAEAEKEHRTVLAVYERTLGPEHPDTLTSRNNLAAVLFGEEKYAEAEQEFRKMVAIEERILGPEHPDTLATRNNLNVALRNSCQYTEAEQEDRSLLVIRLRVLGPEHPDTLRSRNNLAFVLGCQGKYAEAEREYRALLPVKVRVVGLEHPETLRCRNSLAHTLLDEDKYAEAEAEYRAVLAIQERVLGPEHPDTLTTRSGLALTLMGKAEYTQAVETQQKVLTVLQSITGAGQRRQQLIEAYALLARCQLRARDFAGALATAETGRKLDASNLSLEMNRAHAMLLLGKTAEAEAIYLQHRAEKMGACADKTWAQVVLKEFDELEKASLISPEFKRLRQVLKSEAR